MASIALAAPAASQVPATLELLDGSVLPLGRFHGRVLVLNFWATWCAPYRRELAELDSYVAAHARSVAAIAVMAEPRPDLSLAKARAAPLPIPVALRFIAGGGSYPLANGAVPTTYIVDRTGHVVLRRGGAFAPGDLSMRLDMLIGKPVAPAPATASKGNATMGASR